MSYLRSVGVKDIDPARLGVDDKLLDRLFEIAFFGMCRGYFVKTEAVLTGYFAVRPQSERLHIGMGLFYIAAGQYDNAIKIFREDVLKAHPDNDYAKAYLGMALLRTKKADEAKKVLEEVVNAKKEPTVIPFAQALLDEIKAAA